MIYQGSQTPARTRWHRSGKPAPVGSSLGILSRPFGQQQSNDLPGRRELVERGIVAVDELPDDDTVRARLAGNRSAAPSTGGFEWGRDGRIDALIDNAIDDFNEYFGSPVTTAEPPPDQAMPLTRHERDQRWSAALHEAGHCLVAAQLGLIGNSTAIVCRIGDRGDGEAHLGAIPTDPGPLRARIAAILAGGIAECLTWPEGTIAGSSSADHAKACGLIRASFAEQDWVDTYNDCRALARSILTQNHDALLRGTNQLHARGQLTGADIHSLTSHS